MKQYFSLQPYSGFGKSGYRAKFVKRTDKQGRDLGAITTAASAKGMMSAEDLRYAFTRVLDEAVRGACETGEIQHLGPYGSLMLNIHGTFDGVDDAFDPERHSLDFRFVPGAALKGHKPGFSLENVVERKGLVIYEIGPVGYPGTSGRGESRHAVRGYAIGANIVRGLLGEGDHVDWAVETAAREIVTGPFTVLENDAARIILAWPSGVPTDLNKDELTIVFTTHGGIPEGTPQVRRVTIPLYAE